jgi:hypothetical protein
MFYVIAKHLGIIPLLMVSAEHIGVSDADWANDRDDRKSFTGCALIVMSVLLCELGLGCGVEYAVEYARICGLLADLKRPLVMYFKIN